LKEEPKLCDFKEVKLVIPRYKLIKLYFKQNFLQHDEAVFLKAMLWKAEAAENKILHIKSIVEKALLKAP